MISVHLLSSHQNFEGKKKTNMKYIDKKEKEKREAFTCVHTFIKSNKLPYNINKIIISFQKVDLLFLSLP